MSRHLFAFLLTELSTLRVKCITCGLITELGREQIGRTLCPNKCPHCHQTFIAPGDTREAFFSYLGTVLMQAESLADRFTVEFVIPNSE
jgi:hypothetical protein